MYKNILSAAIAVLPFAAFAADDVNSNAELTAPEVVVRGHSPIDATEAALGTSDAAMALKAAPGFSVYSAGGVSGLPVLNGLADDRIKIRIDGAESTSACGNHMNAPLSYISPMQFGSAAVMAGITPVSMGGDSIAGSIDIRSAPPAFADDDGKLFTSGGLSVVSRSVDNGWSAGVNGTVASDRLSLSVNAAQSQADSYKDGNGDKVPDTLYKARNDSLTLAAQGDGNLWVLKAGEQSIPYQGFPNQYMDMTSNDSVFANLGYTGEFGWGKLEGKIYWQDTKHEMGFFTPEKPGTMPMNTHGQDMGYTLKAEWPLSGGSALRLGNEYHDFELDDSWPPVPMSMMMEPNTFVNINNGKRERFALFAEWEGRLNSRWASLLGVRHETVKMDTGNVQDYGCGMMCADDAAAAAAFNARGHAKRDNNLDITATLKYEPVQTASYEFGYAQKTRSPNLYERYTWGRGEMAMSMIGWFGDGNGYVGDIDLKPEVAHTLSATADWHDAGNAAWNFRVTPFYTRVKDFIDVDVIGPGMMVPRLLQLANHDAHLYGINVSWLAPAWDSGSYGSAVFKGKFDWTRGKRDDGGDLYHIMPPNLTLGLEQTVGAWTNTAEVQVVDRKSTVDERRLEIVTGGYSLVNLGTRYQANKWLHLQAGVRNLFDRNYALPLGGANLAIAPGVPLSGQGRSIDVGLSASF